MAKKARERLQELGLAQREASEFAAESRQLSQLPTGGEVRATRLVRPSEAEDVEARTTPFVDFGEFFLNQIGISSPRQVRASIEQARSVNEANNVMIDAAREKFQSIAQRSGGVDQDRLQRVAAALDEGAALMNNSVPEIQEFGRGRLQTAVNELDQIGLDQKDFLDKQRERFQGQIDGVLEIGRQEERDSATVIALLNERGERDGMTSKLSVTEKQVLADYLGGSTFAQKVGAEGIVPSFSIPFDPTEQISVGDASALVQAAKKSRRMVLADQLGDINGSLISSGFQLADQDGKFTVNEIDSPPLGEELQRARFATPQGTPLNIAPGMPTSGAAQDATENFLRNTVGGTVKGAFNVATDNPITRKASELNRGLTDVLDRNLPHIRTPRETN